jgi:arylsulfatase A-like enzyme
MTAPGCLHASKESSHADKRKPNLLFIWTDEQRADTMAAYGNTKIHAPNLNKLAGESVVFERA